MRKIFNLFLLGSFIFTTTAVLANGDSVAAPQAGAVKYSAAAKKHSKKSAKPSAYSKMPYYQPPAVTLYKGSMKANIVRIAHKFGWNTVVWNVPDDYNWVGTTTVSAPTLQQILGKVLINYPLQAMFYQGNHVLVIGPRNLP